MWHGKEGKIGCDTKKNGKNHIAYSFTAITFKSGNYHYTA